MSGTKDKTLPEKLKQFFKFAKSPAAQQSQPVGGPFPRLKVEKFLLTRDIQKALSRETPVGHRLKTLQEISELVATKRIEDDAAETLWLLINDLFVCESAEERQTALMFLKNLITGQYERLGMLRVYIFDIIRESTFNEDTCILIELLKSMTDNGKDIENMEGIIGAFLLHFLPKISQLQLMKDFLPFLLNVIKFNSAYVDANIVDGVVRNLCALVISSLDSGEILQIISVFEAIICYSNLPNESIVIFTSTLCRLVNVSTYSNPSWKVMRNLIGTYLGTTTLYTLIHCLQSSNDATLLRGGIFFIGMVLWTDRPANCPNCPPAVILPALNEALKHSQNPLVVFETGLSLLKLVRSEGPTLVGLAWDWILEIVERFLQFVEDYPKVRECYLDLLTDVEELVEKGEYTGSVPLFFATLERGLPFLSESSVLRLMDFQASNITPSQLHWIANLNKFILRFYVEEKRIRPRLKVLDKISLLMMQRGLYDEELLEVVILPTFQSLHTEHEVEVRKAAVELLVSIGNKCNSKLCTNLLDILDRIMERPFNFDQGDVVNIPSEEELADVVACTHGLINMFAIKVLQLPPSHAVQIYKLLVRHAILHYEKPIYFEFAFSTKLAVFGFILNITTDGQYRLGMVHNGVVGRFSPYILVDFKHGAASAAAGRKENRSDNDVAASAASSSSHGAANIMHISLGEACTALIRCVTKERDWRVLKLVLEGLPKVLANKALVLSRHSSDVDNMAKALCSLITDAVLNNPETLRNAPAKFSRSEFQQYVFRVLACLASYHAHLMPDVQQRLLKGLDVGLKYKDTAKTCVIALTTCSLEMKETMFKLLPGVLLNLSKISATVSIAPNILEFLSTLNRLPEVYSSFVEEQYLSIFAITLPFINPFKFNHYVVSLAHHVVSLWFLSCKLSLRKHFVRYILSGFKTNVLIPSEESMIAQNPLCGDESTARTRSGSLSSHDARRVQRCDVPPPRMPHTQDENRITFHRELMETCADLMSRYTYGNSAPYAQQSDTVRKLLKDGPSQTWMVGHKLVTVTTSHCSRVATRRGLCDRCSIFCRLASDEAGEDNGNQVAASAASASADTMGFRRRHRSAISSLAFSGLDAQLHDGPAPDDVRDKLQRSRHKSSVDERRLSVDFEHDYPRDPFAECDSKSTPTPCVCYCSGWSLVHVRRPTGDTCWVTRVLNPLQTIHDVFLLNDFSEETAPNLAALLNPAPASSGESSCSSSSSSVNTHPRLDRSVSALATVSSPPRPSGGGGGGDQSESGEDAKDRPPITRQTSLKELACSSRKSCEAIPEESKESDSKPDADVDLVPQPRDRVYTMPALNMRRTNDLNPRRAFINSDNHQKDTNVSSAANPSFIFLQLYYSPLTSSVGMNGLKETTDSPPPILVPNSLQTAIKNLDRILPYETHKIGVFYVGKGQVNKEAEILANKHGSVRYVEFLQKLGRLINLNEVDTKGTYIGGLEVSGADGKFAYLWKDDVLQVIFHVATLMPAKDNDPACTLKKRHIGNNYVSIVYNDSGEDYQMNTMRGQFNHACVIVEPLDHATHRVVLKCREDLHEIMGGPVDPKLVSDRNVSLLSRQMAFHANLAAQIIQSKANYPYACNWLERLRQIKRMKARLEKEEDNKEKEKYPWQQQSMLDFTEFTTPRAGS